MPTNAIHMARPVLAWGGGGELGTMLRYGTRKYATGKAYRKYRQLLMVPRRALIRGYRTSCMKIPMVPKIAMARPTLCGCSPRPPVKRNGSWGVTSDSPGSYTGVLRKTNQSELKVPTWNAIRKRAINVSTTLGVNTRLNGNRRVKRFCGRGLAPTSG